MLLDLGEEHKQHLLLLTKHSSQVLQDFCKLTMDYLQKGPHVKTYISAAQKLNEDPIIIKKSVESIVNLLLEGCKSEIKDEDFLNGLIALGFNEEQAVIFGNLYSRRKSEISKHLSATGLKLPQYHDLDWRFEVQVASRAVSQQVVPLVTLDFALKNTGCCNEIEHVTAQTDPNNLLHLVQELELAMQENRSQHIRTISKVIK